MPSIEIYGKLLSSSKITVMVTTIIDYLFGLIIISFTNLYISTKSSFGYCESMNKTSDVMKIAFGGKGLGCGERTVIAPRSVSMLVMQMTPRMLLVTTVFFRLLFNEFKVALSFSNSMDEMESN